MTGSIHGCVERTTVVPVGMGVLSGVVVVMDVGQRTGSITMKKISSTNYCSMVGKRVDMPKDCNLCPYQKRKNESK